MIWSAYFQAEVAELDNQAQASLIRPRTAQAGEPARGGRAQGPLN